MKIGLTDKIRIKLGCNHFKTKNLEIHIEDGKKYFKTRNPDVGLISYLDDKSDSPDVLEMKPTVVMFSLLDKSERNLEEFYEWEKEYNKLKGEMK